MHENIIRDDIIFGKNPLVEALESGVTINKVELSNTLHRDARIDKILDLLKEKKIPYTWVPSRSLNLLAGDQVHQGIVAYRSPYNYYELEDILKEAKKRTQPAFILILDGIEDPHNFGALIRTAEAAGIHGIVIPKHRATTVTAVVAKTSAGAAEHMKIHRSNSLSQIIEKLKQSGLWIVGVEGDSDKIYFEADLTGPIALILGSEGKGVSHNIKKNCDFLVKIPMLGKITSLNVSAAGAVTMFEAVKQKLTKKEL
ncbi:MAG: 23S rRNA (guanosine(2251)-2'-O)-methyltransferase RlmB [Candidatus Margulisiibacteriota bacterium]|nr:MAG: 23S rRNA (guanosine(2251)-2'-O)-methyltransferase RlmB [Candidatus Margulisbacteria bacterium GWD2_39_127]OGI05492.1 MAG: 23S rRNA (guanosine(2251)-2'-O)-methyltransferase RlmB [Candidatus Margulisbacteria bacterium GWF2_38_17]OGI08310.1 MAG: 23S rRNA (guanosine(2251)-2'-O)-methyltransferase RlmB [Candidatus Margulisbacteria bacterium GWE2_39_32]PZM82306.1 MAG: 23S rRNA (guanosine(2251)-2'-O)-methyltransferase RlmB [Candidatus Margulisiibacteriota bacterium]HAR62948.1 23S rRNA (guanosin